MVPRVGAKEVVIGDDRVMQFQGWICVPNVDGLIDLIFEEAHSSRYSIHPGVTKMYRDLKQHYWWRRIKRDIITYVSRCLNCQQVKYEHQKPKELIQRLEIPGAHHYGFCGRIATDLEEPGKARLLGADLVRDALEKVKVIQEQLHTAQTRKKSYADRKVRNVAYMVGEKV
ncbi:uncharacterized protein [Nicotiana tomentosiformis]|uniref:uncharacterized protein n=1 Tax=Nicotiana tomentosiformis TaxID=4098 RepID=UPI00388C5928